MLARVGVAVPHATRVLDARIRCPPSTHLCGETEGDVEVVDKAEAARGFEVGFGPQLKLAREGRVQHVWHRSAHAGGRLQPRTRTTHTTKNRRNVSLTPRISRRVEFRGGRR